MPALRTLSEQRLWGGTQGTYEHDSGVIGLPMRFSVYRPAAAEGAKLPVLYYLAGLECNEQTFAVKSGAQRFASELGLILVACDTSPRGAGAPGEDDDWDFGTGAGFYVDATRAPWSAHYKMYSYATAELPALIAEHFPVDPARAGVFGHSMGGHGALVCGLRNPERFRSISAFAPIAAPSRCPWGHKAFSGYLGDDREAWGTYDASEIVKTSKIASTILIDQGASDKFLETQLNPDVFEAACALSGQALRLRIHPGYDHSYYFITTFVKDHLEHHHRILTV